MPETLGELQAMVAEQFGIRATEIEPDMSCANSVLPMYMSGSGYVTPGNTRNCILPFKSETPFDAPNPLSVMAFSDSPSHLTGQQ